MESSIPNGWKTQKLEDISVIIKRGITPKYTDKECLPIINQKCIRNGTIDFNKIRNHDINAKSIPKDKYLEKYDVLVNSTGVGTLGRVAQFLADDKGSFTVDSHVTIVRPMTDLNPVFFGYAVKNAEKLIESLGEGSTGQTELSRKRLGSQVLINLPTKLEQELISILLSTLDKKIEINNTIMANLEEQSQTIFKNWFVDFEPFQDGKFVNTELGLIPENWQVDSLSRLFNIKYGKLLPTKQLTDKGYPVFGGNGQIGYYKEYMFDEPKILISCRGAASGKVVISYPNSFITNNSLVMDENERNNFYYYNYYFKNFDFSKFATGSAQPQITITNIADIKIYVPTQEKIEEFNKVIAPMNNFQENLMRQNKSLSEVRDTLLPKLMSGEIRVGELEEA